MSTSLRRPSDAPPARMRPLPKLPVFLDLARQRAVVAGGTAAAAWKAELLAAAGAEVEVYAECADAEMEALIARDHEVGCIRYYAHSWRPSVLAGARIAVADCGTEEEARRFYDATVAAGVPVNVIDKPAFCQFQFGSVVNRAPVVIGISTDGAAPILGQAIRRRIETLLPPTLAPWVNLAKEMRDAVAARLSPGQQRRVFWERLSDKAMSGDVPQSRDEIDRTIAAIEASPDVTTGRVTLVGAGPGDPELLTLKAVRAMQSADVILFDDLVSPDVLELARREAKRMLVGKRGRRASCRQDDINDLMIKLARQGKHVVRLKSGDPMIFGRAGEEIEALRKEGIPVAVVPGITAASGMASALGASLTHRDYAQSVRFVTGHARNGELPGNLDWRGLADADTTLVVYMGGRTAGSVGQNLLREGLDGDTPVIVQQNVARPDTHSKRLKLRELAEVDGTALSGGPTLIGIGRVFADAAIGAADAHAPPACLVDDSPLPAELVRRMGS